MDEQQRLAEPKTTEQQTVQTPILPKQKPHHEQIMDILLNKDDISWQQIIFSAVKSEEMDPWNIDIAKLSQHFLEKLREFKEMDFKVSGKVILAAAILLRLKSNKLVGEDLTYLDQLIASSNHNEEEAFYDELASMEGEKVQVSIEGRNYELIPHTPQPRKRKVSVFDLVEALEKALEVKNRRKGWGGDEVHMEIPKMKYDIEELVQKIFQEVVAYFSSKKEETLTFTKLLHTSSREDKIFTFLPLLHLSNEGKVVLQQATHLGEIEIGLGMTETKKAVQNVAAAKGV